MFYSVLGTVVEIFFFSVYRLEERIGQRENKRHNPQKAKVLLNASGKRRDTISLMTSEIDLGTITESTRLYCKLIAPTGVQPADKE